MSHDDLLPLIELIYQAGAEPAHWRDVLNRIIARHHGSAVLFIQDTSTHSAGFVEHAGSDPAFLRAYSEHYAAINPMKDRWAAMPEGAIVEAHKMVEQSVFYRSEFYNDFFRPMDAYHAIGSTILKSGPVITNFAMQRPRQAGMYDEAELARFRVLSAHVGQSLRMARALAMARWTRDAAASPAAGPESGLIFTTAEGRILLADPAAETILRADDGLGSVNGHLSAATPAFTARLAALIQEAARTAASKGMCSGGILGLPKRRAGPPLAVLVGPWHGSAIAIGVPGPAVLVIVEDPGRAPMPGAAGAAVLYNLTAAETRLLEALLAGQRLADYAAAARIGLATAKTHLGALFAKTGQRRQTDLVRAVLSSAIARQPVKPRE